jgi:uncharacterized protein (TIGR02246 family)
MRFTIGFLALGLALSGGAPVRADDKQPTEDESTIQRAREHCVKAFNAGNAGEYARSFAMQAELVDEYGTVYKGRGELEKLFTQFFQDFAGARLDIKPEALRFVAPGVAVEDAIHVVKAKDNASEARHRWVCVWSRQGKDWLICSARQYADEAALSPHDRLQPLAWLVGDWVDEDPESVVTMSCRWSKDRNYVLCDYNVQLKGKKVLDATQRIGWDPLARQIRSWVFDSDGGFSQGVWTRDGDRWIIKSTGVLPEGTSSSATFTLSPQGKDRFLWKSMDRVSGDAVEPDFEVVIVRKAPPAK